MQDVWYEIPGKDPEKKEYLLEHQAWRLYASSTGHFHILYEDTDGHRSVITEGTIMKEPSGSSQLAAEAQERCKEIWESLIKED